MTVRLFGKIVLLLLVGFLVTGCVIRVESPAPKEDDSGVGGPMPLLNTEGLDQYGKHKLFASRYIEEGDFPLALEELASAEKIRADEPALFELKAIAYDADRQSMRAYDNFKIAARMYIEAGNRDKAVQMLGWLRTFQSHDDDSEYTMLEHRAGLLK